MYLRTARDDLPLSLYPLVMSHDSATGELDERRDGLIAAWAKTQPASLVGQLDCGARAFDYCTGPSWRRAESCSRTTAA